MLWQSYLKNFKNYLTLERGASVHTLDAYLRDVQKLAEYLDLQGEPVAPSAVTDAHLFNFLYYLGELGVAPATQARILSGLKAFFKFLLLEEVLVTDPSVNLESPRLGRKLPDTLSFPEIET
ncbi:MAG: site-specific integrase, partial [Sphingobacteriaceae bacterium]|nr:site-specific integrase [Cytophagaceae bacterium]